MLGHNWNRRYHSPYKSRLFCRDGTFRFSKWTEYASWELSKASILRLANSCQVATAEVHPVYGLHFPPPEAHQTVEAPASDSDATIIDDSDATIVEERLYDSDSTVKPTMPYNVSAIAPSEEISGTTTLPLARVKKILAADEDINSVSANAAFAITIATEMFIRYLAEQSYNVVKSEKKNRRNIHYKDVAEAVSRIDNLQFLEDIIPKTTTYRAYKVKKATKAKQSTSLQNGQTTLDGQRAQPQRAIDSQNAHLGYMQGVHASGAAVHNPPGPPTPSQPNQSNGQRLIFEHYEPHGAPRRDDSGDAEMN